MQGTIDVTLRVPLDTPEAQAILAILTLGGALDLAKQSIDEARVGVEQADDVVYVSSGRGMLEAIKARACKAAQDAFVASMLSPETISELKEFSGERGQPCQ